MENTYYILSNEKLVIPRFHICTWDVISEPTFIEFGIEIQNDQKLSNEITLHLAIPFITNKCTITSLDRQLSNEENCRFVFNDILRRKKMISNDVRDGIIIEFESRNELAILPVESTIDEDNKVVILKIRKQHAITTNLYIRILIQTNYNTLSIKKTGITKNTYIYDVKINETRNLSDKIYSLKTKCNLCFCKIESVFCLHSIPDSYDITFADSKKLKNIRKLEIDAFQKYLPCIKSLKEDKYIIAFNKDSNNNNSFSFFSVFSNETIGNKQIIVAVITNIICGLLFSLPYNENIWYKQWNFFVATMILLVLMFWLFRPLKRIRIQHLIMRK